MTDTFIPSNSNHITVMPPYNPQVVSTTQSGTKTRLDQAKKKKQAAEAEQ